MNRLLLIFPATLILICFTSMLQAKEGDCKAEEEDYEAEEGDYCSGIGSRLAVMSDKPGGMSITEDGKTKFWRANGSLATGLSGLVYVPEPDDGTVDILFITPLVLDYNLKPPDKVVIKIFQERAYFPCDRK